MKRAWINIAVGIGCGCLLLSLLVSMVLQSREYARRSQCKNNLKQWGVALRNYHDTHTMFPPYAGGTHENGERLSGRVMLLNFLGSSRIWHEIQTSPGQGGDPMAMLSPSLPVEMPVFLCPSSDIPFPVDRQPHASYVFCAGDQLDFGSGVADFPNQERTRGGFGWRRGVSLKEIKDGISNTITMAERDLGNPRDKRETFGRVAVIAATTVRDCKATASDGQYLSSVSLLSELMGERWASGHPLYSVFMTAVPPNGPSCAASGPPSGRSVGGWFTASSRHIGDADINNGRIRGCNVLLFDGAVRYVSEKIDHENRGTDGEPSKPHKDVSPWGIWGCLGTIDGNDCDCHCEG